MLGIKSLNHFSLGTFSFRFGGDTVVNIGRKINDSDVIKSPEFCSLRDQQGAFFFLGFNLPNAPLWKKDVWFMASFYDE